MSEFEKREGILACPRCKAPMKEILRIAPVQSEPTGSRMNARPAATSPVS